MSDPSNRDEAVGCSQLRHRRCLLAVLTAALLASAVHALTLGEALGEVDVAALGSWPHAHQSKAPGLPLRSPRHRDIRLR